MALSNDTLDLRVRGSINLSSAQLKSLKRFAADLSLLIAEVSHYCEGVFVYY